jgi:hypothetical protein
MRPAVCDASEIAAFQHQFGGAAPRGDAAIAAAPRRQEEIAGAHVHLARLRGAPGFGQCGVERRVQFRLHRGRVRAFARRGQRDGQQVLLHFHRAAGLQLQHVLGRRQDLRASAGGSEREEASSE